MCVRPNATDRQRERDRDRQTDRQRDAERDRAREGDGGGGELEYKKYSEHLQLYIPRSTGP